MGKRCSPNLWVFFLRIYICISVIALVVNVNLWKSKQQPCCRWLQHFDVVLSYLSHMLLWCQADMEISKSRHGASNTRILKDIFGQQPMHREWNSNFVKVADCWSWRKLWKNECFRKFPRTVAERFSITSSRFRFIPLVLDNDFNLSLTKSESVLLAYRLVKTTLGCHELSCDVALYTNFEFRMCYPLSIQYSQC